MTSWQAGSLFLFQTLIRGCIHIVSYFLLEGLSHNVNFLLGLDPRPDAVSVVVWCNTPLDFSRECPLVTPDRHAGSMGGTGKRMLLWSLFERCQTLVLLVANKLKAMLKLLSCYVGFLGNEFFFLERGHPSARHMCCISAGDSCSLLMQNSAPGKSLHARIQRRHHQGMIPTFNKIMCSLLATLLASLWKAESKSTVHDGLVFLLCVFKRYVEQNS